MINLVISNNAGTERYIEDPNKTIMELCEQYGLDLTAGNIMVNAVTMSAAQMSKSPAELGITGTLMISQYKSLKNA